MEVPVINANSVYQDQTLRSAVADLSLHCLPMSLNGTLGIYELTFKCLPLSAAGGAKKDANDQTAFYVCYGKV